MISPGEWRGVFTVVMLVLFVAICIWAYSKNRKADFEAAAQLPLEPDNAGPDDTADC